MDQVIEIIEIPINQSIVRIEVMVDGKSGAIFYRFSGYVGRASIDDLVGISAELLRLASGRSGAPMRFKRTPDGE